MNIDSKRPQAVHITWSRKEVHDDTQDAPDANNDGFWPSLNPDAAGYIGANPERSFEEQQAAAQARYDGFYAADWHYVSVIAHAEIYVPIGGNSFRILELDSAGLWGVESDSGEDYLQSIFEEEKADLRSQLVTLGLSLATPDQLDGAEAALETDA